MMRPAAIAPHPQQQQQQQHKPLINRFETETHRLEDDVRKEVDKMTGYEGIVAVGTAALLYFLALLEGALYIGTVIQLEYQAGLATPAVVLFFGAFFILFYRDQAISLGSVVVILIPLLVWPAYSLASTINVYNHCPYGDMGRTPSPWCIPCQWSLPCQSDCTQAKTAGGSLCPSTTSISATMTLEILYVIGAVVLIAMMAVHYTKVKAVRAARAQAPR